MADHPRENKLTERLSPLWGKLRPTAADCPFRVDQSLAADVELSHASAGRDAIYVGVARKCDGKVPLKQLAVTIQYSPSVEGTTIIYDLLNETMQGKARPFQCDLSSQWVRPFLLLPFQEENLSLAVRGSDEKRVVEVAFLDAREEIIQAALPFQFRVMDSSGKAIISKYAATNRNGKFVHELPPISTNVTVHTCLTGQEETIRL